MWFSCYRVLLAVCCLLLVGCCWVSPTLSLLFDVCRLQFGGARCLLVAVFCVVRCLVFRGALLFAVDWYLLVVGVCCLLFVVWLSVVECLLDFVRNVVVCCVLCVV